MYEDSIAKLARELDKQLAERKSLAPKDRQILEDLRSDIQNLLDVSDLSTERNADIVDKLRSATEHFEGSHPTLTVVMSQVINTLSNMGI